MRILPSLGLMLALVMPCAAPAQFASPNVTYIAPPAEDMITLVKLRHAVELEKLRDEGMRLRRADGGTLTLGHRNFLQTKLDEVEASYLAGLRRYDPLIVDASGRSR